MDNILTMLDKLIRWLSLPQMRLMDFVEIILIAVLFYNVTKWIKTTRAWVIVKGILVLLVFWLIASLLNMHAILWIFYKKAKNFTGSYAAQGQFGHPFRF